MIKDLDRERGELRAWEERLRGRKQTLDRERDALEGTSRPITSHFPLLERFRLDLVSFRLLLFRFAWCRFQVSATILIDIPLREIKSIDTGVQ